MRPAQAPARGAVQVRAFEAMLADDLTGMTPRATSGSEAAHKCAS